MSRPKLWFGALAVALFVAWLAFLRGAPRDRHRAPAPAAADEPASVEQSEPLAPASSALTPTHASPAKEASPAPSVALSPVPPPIDERALTMQLRGLLGKDPALAVKLAREANERNPASPEAPERAWIVVKSLTDLNSFDEARREATIMLERYGGSEWAQDVKHHVLEQPPGLPEPATPEH